MKPAVTISHNEMRGASLQQVQREDLRALISEYALYEEGFSDMR